MGKVTSSSLDRMMRLHIAFILGFLLSKSHSISIHKRSDDSNPLTAVVEQLADQVSDIQARLDTLVHHVAFTTQFSVDRPTVQPSTPLKFDRVIFNDGNAYDPTLGIFTAPVSGVYTFSLQVFTGQPERPMMDICVNGVVIHRMAMDTTQLASHNNGEDSTSMTTNLRLALGDRVWIQMMYNRMTFIGQFHTFFTGALLYAV